MSDIRKTIYISEECLQKVKQDVGLAIYQGQDMSVTRKLSMIVEEYYSLIKTPKIKEKVNLSVNEVSKNAQKKVDIAVLGDSFTSKDLRALYLKHGLKKRSAEIKIDRLKKEGKIVVVGRGKYKVL